MTKRELEKRVEELGKEVEFLKLNSQFEHVLRISHGSLDKINDGLKYHPIKIGDYPPFAQVIC